MSLSAADRADALPYDLPVSPRLTLPLSLAAGVAVTTVLLVLQAVIQNVHIVTTNGLWKSFVVVDWMNDPRWSRLDLANALYFPAYAQLCRFLDLMGVFPGVVWRQMAVLNAIFAGAAAAACFAFVAAWTQRLAVAALATVAFCLSGYAMALGLVNEDIMPGYALVLAATLMAAGWFGRPTVLRIAAVALVFACGWLVEWRLMFPALPPFLLALLLAPGTASQRVMRPMLFLLFMAVPPLVVTLLAWSDGAYGAASAAALFKGLFWAGKGVGSGWAGFSIAKVWYLWAGMSEAVMSGRHVLYPNWINRPEATGVFAGTALGLVLAAACLVHVARRTANPAVRGAFIVVGGTLACGMVFNLYSQPQDPQMQINVMIWPLFGWAILVGALLGPWRAAAPGMRLSARAAAILLVLVPPAFAVQAAYAKRGYDARMTGLVSRLEARFDPSRTVFAWLDFDGRITWVVASWGNTPPNVPQLGPAPQETPRFKWIGLVRRAVETPGWSGAEHAQDIIGQIDRALALGYRVVTAEMWGREPEFWIASFSTVASARKALEIRDMLLGAFEAQPVWQDPDAGPWYELTRRAP
jgi:hypothetical protein